MPDRPSVAEVVAKLQTYGSADQIAQFFEREGVTGQVRESGHCPVANYVRRETGQVISATKTTVWGEHEFVDFAPDNLIAEFIQRFDLGQYEGLIS